MRRRRVRLNHLVEDVVPGRTKCLPAGGDAHALMAPAVSDHRLRHLR